MSMKSYLFFIIIYVWSSPIFVSTLEIGDIDPRILEVIDNFNISDGKVLIHYMLHV